MTFEKHLGKLARQAERRGHHAAGRPDWAATTDRIAKANRVLGRRGHLARQPDWSALRTSLKGQVRARKP